MLEITLEDEGMRAPSFDDCLYKMLMSFLKLEDITGKGKCIRLPLMQGYAG